MSGDSSMAIAAPDNMRTNKSAVITILGATGSIGLNTLDVIARHPEQFSLFAVTAHSKVAEMLAICKQHKPRYAVMGSAEAASKLRTELHALNLSTEVLVGEKELVAVSEASDVDVVMAAIVGAAGLLPTLAAIRAGKRVLLANKEALVMSGQLFIDAVRSANAQLLPVDSEHNAIFQALPQAVQQDSISTCFQEHGIRKILLTGSGGPFRETPLADIASQTPAAACAHPNWLMGAKISVDSATMLNKGLEYIEARWLFNCNADQLDVILHPQSVIHSMVQYIDGSVIAQLGQPDMRTPIAYCLGYPERLASGVADLDFTEIGAFTFAKPEAERYPLLQLAIDACWQGQAATTALNAANEEAVAAFLSEQISFGEIAEICTETLQKANISPLNDIEAVLNCDAEARRIARKHIQRGR